MSMIENLPEALKGAKDFLVKAEQFKKLDPVVAVYCKVYACDLVTKTLDRSDKSAVSFLMQLMDQVDKEKKALGPVEDPQQQVERAGVVTCHPLCVCAGQPLPKEHEYSCSAPCTYPTARCMPRRTPRLRLFCAVQPPPTRHAPAPTSQVQPAACGWGACCQARTASGGRAYGVRASCSGGQGDWRVLRGRGRWSSWR